MTDIQQKIHEIFDTFSWTSIDSNGDLVEGCDYPGILHLSYVMIHELQQRVVELEQIIKEQQHAIEKISQPTGRE